MSRQKDGGQAEGKSKRQGGTSGQIDADCLIGHPGEIGYAFHRAGRHTRTERDRGQRAEGRGRRTEDRCPARRTAGRRGRLDRIKIVIARLNKCRSGFNWVNFAKRT